MAHCDFAPRFLPTKIREEPKMISPSYKSKSRALILVGIEFCGGPHLDNDTRIVAGIPVRCGKSNRQINAYLTISIHDPGMG